MTTLFQNATYLKPDCAGWGSGDLLISDGVISAIAPADSRLVADEIINARGMLLIPGLINAHAHSYTAFLKGSIDNLPLDLYMLHAIAGGSSRSEREIYICTLLSAAQMLKQGTTSVIDHFSQRPRQELAGVQAAVTAYLESGMRPQPQLLCLHLRL